MADPFSTIGGAVATAGAVYNLADAIFGSDEPSDWQKEQYFENRNYSRAMAERNIALQREFAQHGIRWKMEDAKAAGIHPVAALGAGGASFAPISVGDTAPADAPRSRIGDALMDMGQNVSRAVKATQTADDRFRTQMQELELEGKKLENTLIGQRIAAIQRAQLGPTQPDAASAEEPIIQPDITYTKTKRGGIAPVPSESFADRAEDQFIPQMAWAARNMLLPQTPNRSPGKGRQWTWNPFRFEFESVPVNKKQPWDISTLELIRRWKNNEPYTGPLPKRKK